MFWGISLLSSCVCFGCFPEIGPASVMVGNLVSGKRIAQASGRDLGQIEDNDQARKVSAAQETPTYLYKESVCWRYSVAEHVAVAQRWVGDSRTAGRLGTGKPFQSWSPEHVFPVPRGPDR